MKYGWPDTLAGLTRGTVVLVFEGYKGENEEWSEHPIDELSVHYYEPAIDKRGEWIGPITPYGKADPDADISAEIGSMGGSRGWLVRVIGHYGDDRETEASTKAAALEEARKLIRKAIAERNEWHRIRRRHPTLRKGKHTLRRNTRGQRILFSGSRHWSDEAPVRKVIAGLPSGSVVVHGGAKGLDSMAGRIAKEHGLQVEVYPADWSRGRKAGPERNQEMVDAGADAVYAFPVEGSRGTWDLVRRAEKAGLPVKIHKGRANPKTTSKPTRKKTVAKKNPGASGAWRRKLVSDIGNWRRVKVGGRFATGQRYCLGEIDPRYPQHCEGTIADVTFDEGQRKPWEVTLRFLDGMDDSWDSPTMKYDSFPQVQQALGKWEAFEAGDDSDWYPSWLTVPEHELERKYDQAESLVRKILTVATSKPTRRKTMAKTFPLKQGQPLLETLSPEMGEVYEFMRQKGGHGPFIHDGYHIFKDYKGRGWWVATEDHPVAVVVGGNNWANASGRDARKMDEAEYEKAVAGYYTSLAEDDGIQAKPKRKAPTRKKTKPKAKARAKLTTKAEAFKMSKTQLCAIDDKACRAEVKRRAEKKTKR